jgi:phosphoribosylanthranilate isomerase
MKDAIHIKVCGLTSLADAEFADAQGVEYLGFNLYPKSPRYFPLAQYRSVAASLPGRRTVAVTVEPGPGELSALRDAGFDLFQVHFRHDRSPGVIAAWSEEVGAANLWLAPKLPPGVEVDHGWLGLAGSFVLDTFDGALFGGTGRTSDWPKFRRHREANPGHTWILSGGLSADNVADALAGSGARFVDVNSGVESSPGVKDPDKLRAFVARIRPPATG